MATFLPFRFSNAAEVVDDVQHIGHALRRMVDVALQVDERRTLLKNAVAVAFLQSVHERLLVLMALMDVHIVADADDVGHEGDHVGRLTDRLAVGNLGLLLVEGPAPRGRELQAEAKEKRVRVELSRNRRCPDRS